MRKVLVLFALFSFSAAADSARRIEREVIVSAPRAEVWSAWSSVDGAKTFFAPEANIEATPGGRYEILFDMSQPAGLRGGEGNRVIALEPQRMLLFSWNAPPKFGPLRDERTYVVLRFDDAAGGGTKVRLTHFGWRNSAEWDPVYAYFEAAWTHVMNSFAKRYGAR